MSEPSYPHESQADLPGVAFASMRQIILMQVQSANLTVLEDRDERLTVETAHGLIGLRRGDNAETAGMVAAADEHWLFVMKTAVVQQMRHLMPDVADAIRWSNGPAAGSLPPNFAFAQVSEVEELGPVFLRVTLEGEDLSSHGDEAIHFRLVQPPKGSKPEWPTVAPNGSIAWPDGPSAPHRPVYTTRFIDHTRNTLVTDVFLHNGGRTTEWAREVRSGERGRRVVGLVGPSGGGLLNAGRVLMASDETGFPAAARLLEQLPDGATGRIYLEAQDGADCAYPIEAPPGVALAWLSRSKGESLADATLEALPQFIGSKVWFAGERQDAARVRSAAKDAGWESGDLRISGFWSKE